MAKLLIVDDDENFLGATARFCALKGHETSTAPTIAAARRILGDSQPDVLLLDLMLPDGNGLELLDELRDSRPARIALLTGHPGIKDLIRGMQGPAVSYLTKPLDTDALLELLANAGEPVADGDDAFDDDGSGAHFGTLVGDSPDMQAVYAQIEQVAPLDTTVFIRGESGTGKELVAQAIHRLSGRSGRFVPVNCGGLSRELVASELFGHERGSFTGANRRHVGFFERANKGTLFLDEITEMPGEVQTHLLRALETGRILRVGGEDEVPVEARLLAATNRDPAEAVREGLLREDLFFRLQVFPIDLPPLRLRRGDIRQLADYFLERVNQSQESALKLSAAAYDAMEDYDWPGNVRELKHAVQRAAVMAGRREGEIDLPEDFRNCLDSLSTQGVQPGRSIRDVEKDLILSTLEHFDGDKKAAAESLGVSLKTLYNRLNQYEAGDPIRRTD